MLTGREGLQADARSASEQEGLRWLLCLVAMVLRSSDRMQPEQPVLAPQKCAAWYPLPLFASANGFELIRILLTFRNLRKGG